VLLVSLRPNIQSAQLTSKQILDLLHVDFHIADFDCIFNIAIGFDDCCEYLLDYTWYETFEGLICDIGPLKISFDCRSLG
jgi:hypothetical protein